MSEPFSHTHASQFPESLIAAMLTGNYRDTAIGFARLGAPVLPAWSVEPDGSCSCGRPGCPTPGKHPLSRLVDHGVRDASTDAHLVREWWAVWPDANIAVVMGGRFTALDLDPRNGADLTDDYGAPATWTERTGGGGQHRLYHTPDGGVASHTVAPGVEVKGEGSYVIVSPSRHASGHLYQPLAPYGHPVTLLPDHLAMNPVATVERVRLTPPGTPVPAPVRKAADQVRRQLLAGPFGTEVRRLLAGDYGFRYPSPSEAEAGLISMATLFTRDPLVLDALIRHSRLMREKWYRPDRTFGTYGARTIAVALAWRHRQEQDRREASPAYQFARQVNAKYRLARAHRSGRLDSGLGKDKRRAAAEAIVRFLGAAWPQHGELVQIPVDLMADGLSIHRNTIGNALDALIERGIILPRTVERTWSPTGHRTVVRSALALALPDALAGLGITDAALPSPQVVAA